MTNKSFFYGLGIGILGCNMISILKDELRPLAVKAVGGTISAGTAARAFMEDVHKKALEKREERFSRTAESIGQKSVNSFTEISENIEILKKQFEELKNKVEVR